jgi:DNA polymerase III subunit chi
LGRVDFHVLAEEAPDARLRYACRLAEEHAERGLRVYLQTASAGETQRLDDLLWTYNDRSFLPHEIYSGSPASHERVRVMVGEQAPPSTLQELLINLSESVPADLDAYPHIIEIVDIDPERKRTARERYKQYRERGCTLESKNV